VIPPQGGKPVPYTRCTTFIDCIEEKTALVNWQKRMVAIGLSQRPDLLLAVSATDVSNRKAINDLCEQAMEAAKAKAGATTGSALHSLTERIDKGEEVGPVPADYLPDLAAYTEATQSLKHVLIEQFCVLDAKKIGGTPDRVVRYKGKRYIADLKTGSIELGILKISMQLAVYARSNTYDFLTGERGVHGAEVDKGLIIHLPAGTGTCELLWVDLVEGWYAVQVAQKVREARKIRFDSLVTPFESPDTITSPIAEGEIHRAGPDPLVATINACLTAEQVREVWKANAAIWTDDLTAAAKAHIASLS
jgi:hypothetical protein